MDTKYLEIIKAPVITEKSGNLAQSNQYVFKVDHRANKTEIKQAIEKIFNVKVEEIRTINVKPKKRRVGRYTGLTNRTKKAIVTLAEGQQIELN
ncbi:MAG: 50S ribosomal protein L23 [Bacilli bacterium]|nr:50S ribosomal protein L23 [Bacilli bacterium]